MRTVLYSIAIFISLAGGLVAQAAKPTNPAKPTEKLGTHVTPDLPSEATVDSFLHQQFGYQADMTWKIASIKPSEIEGLAEITVILANGQGQQSTRFFVSPDGQHALIGDVIPFGARPFDPAKKILDAGVTGPSRGPK